MMFINYYGSRALNIATERLLLEPWRYGRIVIIDGICLQHEICSITSGLLVVEYTNYGHDRIFKYFLRQSYIL